MTTTRLDEALHGARLRAPEVEAAYRDRFLQEDARIAVTLLALLGLVTVASGLNDGRFIESPELLSLVRAGRVANLVATAATIWLMLRVKRPLVLDLLVLGWVCFGSAFSFCIQVTRPADYLLPIMSEAAYTMMIWSLMPNRFSFQALGAAALFAEGVGWLLVSRRPLQPQEVVLIAVTFLTANLGGAVLSFRAHRLRRRLFLEHRLLVASQAEVKRLSSLLPICMYCKKIRDERGQWQPLEGYITQHTQSKFSHGMCDDCDAVHGADA